MERLKLVFESEKRINAEAVIANIKGLGLTYKSVAREKMAVPKQAKCCKDKPLPSKIQQAKNLVKAAAEHVKTGRERTSHDEFIRRLTICNQCDSLSSKWQCAECGCYMKVKAEMKEQKCKLSKW